jgi:hypothetical protein
MAHQAHRELDDGQFDARVLDLDYRRRSVRGRRHRGVPLREKSVAADREAQRLDVSTIHAGKQTNCHKATARDPCFSVSDRWKQVSWSMLCAQLR